MITSSRPGGTGSPGSKSNFSIKKTHKHSIQVVTFCLRKVELKIDLCMPQVK